MTEPKLYGSVPGRTHEPIIWAVDDAWFDNYGEHSISLDFQLKRTLKKGISSVATLSELKEIIEAGHLEGIISGDSEYLNNLVQLCLQNNLQLGLCNFDCFRNRFLLLNQPGSAILLDVNCPISHASDYPPDGYGIHLLHEVLDGARPRADIFLVTGYPDLAQQIIRNKRYHPTWWPLQGVQIVDKSDSKLKDSLEAFIRYFVQGLERDPFVKLARGLIKARRGNTHPNTLAELEERTKGLPLAESFVRLEREKAGQGRASFKALYHSRAYADDKDMVDIAPEVVEASEGNLFADEGGFASGGDRVTSEILADHCSFLGIDLNVDSCRELYLPIQPGLVFILYFCAFMRGLDEKPIAQLSCNENQDGGIGKLFIPLESTIALQAAVYGSEELGEATLWFKRAITGRGEGVIRLAEISEVSSRLPWKHPRPIGKGRTYPLIVQPTFLENGVELTWKWPEND